MSPSEFTPITQEEQSLITKIVAKQVYYGGIVEQQAAALRKLWPDPLDASRKLKVPLEALPVDPVKRAERVLEADAVCKGDAKTTEERLAIIASGLLINQAIAEDEIAPLPQHVAIHATKMLAESDFWSDPDALTKEKALGEIYGKLPELAPAPIPHLPASSSGLEPALSRHGKIISDTLTSSQIESVLADGQDWLGQHLFLLEDGVEDDGGIMMRLVGVGTSLRDGKWFEVQYEWDAEGFADRLDAEGMEFLLQGVRIVLETSKL